MKKGLFLAARVTAFCAQTFQSQAHEYDRDDSDHPLRLIAYAVHPVGIAVECRLGLVEIRLRRDPALKEITKPCQHPLQGRVLERRLPRGKLRFGVHPPGSAGGGRGTATAGVSLNS